MTQQKTSPRKISAAEKRKQALELRKAGFTFQQIGDQLGVTRGMAFRYVKDTLDEINEKQIEEAKQIRTLEVERLDRLWVVSYQQAKNGNLGAVDRCIKIMERRSKLLGLDAPQKVEQENTNINMTWREFVERSGDDNEG